MRKKEEEKEKEGAKLVEIDPNMLILHGLELWSCYFDAGQPSIETFNDMLMVLSDLCGDKLKSLRLTFNGLGLFVVFCFAVLWMCNSHMTLP